MSNKNTTSISSKILKSGEVEWAKLEVIQNKSFKDLPPEAQTKLRNSLCEKNFVQPFYVWEHDNKVFCLDGVHRIRILEELKKEGVDVPELLPAVFLDCANKKAAAELVLLFSSAYAKITQDGLNEFIKLNDIDFSAIGGMIDLPDFSMARFEQKFDTAGLGDMPAEETPEPQANVPLVTSPGDMFQLGTHRLFCGSFLDTEGVATLMAGQKARIIATDPPYNLAVEQFSNAGKTEHTDFAMGAGEMSDDEFAEFLHSIMHASCQNSVDGSIHYIFMDWRHSWHMGEAAKKAYGSPIPKQHCVWNKDIMANGSFYRAKHEFCFIYKHGEATHLSHLLLQDRIRTNIWDYPSGTSLANPDKLELSNHPTPKPVKMVADLILDTTNPQDLVIDWFLGSGTTLIAAAQTDRICYGTEIEPKYCDSIIRRYMAFCKKNDLTLEFEHLNGDLTPSHFDGTADPTSQKTHQSE